MNVVGIGTDIVDCDRIAQMIEKHDETFLAKVYTSWEIDYCGRHTGAAYQHYAGRWAAKEAILKAIGTGWARGIQWTDIEVQNIAGGAPIVQLHNRAREICDEKGIDQILISISHTKLYATAFATAVGPAATDPS